MIQLLGAKSEQLKRATATGILARRIPIITKMRTCECYSTRQLTEKEIYRIDLLPGERQIID